MKLLEVLNNSIKALPVLSRQPLPAISFADPLRMIGNEIQMYPQDNGERYLSKGYNLNDAVFSIVSKNAEKAGQVRFYHSKVKKDETKTLSEYKELSKGALGPKALKELGIMRKAMIEDLAVDSPLSKLLNKPTRYQTQSEWLEQLFGLRELQGEGNIWINKGDGEKPLELLLIPKPHLSLVGDGRNPWNIIKYIFTLNGETIAFPKEDVLMWKYSNPCAIDTTLNHMRGLAPLQSAMVLVQGMNEGDKRIATSNASGGALGMAFKKTQVANDWTSDPVKALAVRQQFDNIINSNDMGGKIAVMGGEWGYLNFGVSTADQQLLEQYGMGFTRLCRVFKTPSGLFNDDATYNNQPQYKRSWIYDKIAPNLYHLRGLLSDALIPAFNLDPERHIVDCDINSLPDLATDLKEQVQALKEADWLSDNEKRDASGYEQKLNPILDLTGREYESAGIGGNLDGAEKLLND